MFFRVFLIVVLLIFATSNCAKRGRPTGGPKDSLPPIMEGARPPQETTNFNSKEIRIYFDEFVKLKELNKQLVVSPPLKYNPIITPLGTPSKFIKIKILDTLRENTTYTFNFGQSIVDNTEGNILSNFKYVFSTGDVIDSLKISGTVKDAYNQEADKNIAVMLYEVNEAYTDSVIFKEKPYYVANTLDTIVWEMTNLKAGKYLLVASNDVSRDYVYSPKEDKIGFVSQEIEIPIEENFEITLFKEILPYQLLRPEQPSKNHIIFPYQGIADSLKVRPFYSIDSLESLSIFEKEKDSLNYWFKGIKQDSIQFLVSNKKYIDTVTVRLRSKDQDSLNISSTIRGILKLRDTLKLTSITPIVALDTSKIKIVDKDTLPVTYSSRLSDELDKVTIDFEKKYNDSYRLQILPEAITDFFGNVNDTINVGFSTKQPSDYGNAFLTLQNVKSYPIIVDLIDENSNLIERVYADQAQEFEFRSLEPAKYKIRVIYDDNKNSKWDTGNFLNKLQPEKVVYFSEEVEIRANWDVTETLILK